MSTEDYASADDLITGDLDLEGSDLLLPSGKKVRVRGLTRGELMHSGKAGQDEDPAEMEVRWAATCLLAPKMSVTQVRNWQRNASAGGDFKLLSEAIRDLSGLGTGAQKSHVPEVRD